MTDVDRSRGSVTVPFVGSLSLPVKGEKPMMQKLRKLIRRDGGQGMTEYIIIVALIAIAAIGVVTVFGDNIRALFGASVDSLNAQDSTVNTKAQGQTSKHKTLKTFTSNNTAGQ